MQRKTFIVAAGLVVGRVVLGETPSALAIRNIPITPHQGPPCYEHRVKSLEPPPQANEPTTGPDNPHAQPH
jgi:hypothetical protein